MDISQISCPLFKDIIYKEYIDSTNNWAKRFYLEHKCIDNKIFIAEMQNGGKGRKGRHWISNYGNQINMSLLLNSNIDTNKLQLICLCAALAVNNAIIKVTGLKSKIKWPNDIVINNRKICGILCESIFPSKNETVVIIGIGINIKDTSFPENIKNKATSIFLELGEKFSRAKLINVILKEFEFYYNKLISSKIDDIIAEYKTFCISINKNIIFNVNDQKIYAKAIDISPVGELIVSPNSGTIKYINHGEIIHQDIYESEDKSI